MPANITNVPTNNGNLTLNHNAIQSALLNMIISQDVLGGSINTDNYNLVDEARVDGSLYGDTKLYIDVPTTVSTTWVQDSEEALNLLKTHRPADPKTQALTMGVYRQCAITRDSVLSKNAFGTEGAFSQYQSILNGRLSKTKAMYDDLTYKTFFATTPGNVSETVALYASPSSTEQAKQNTEAIAEKIANIVGDMKDYNTKYTSNGFIRAFNDEEIKVVWNQKYLNALMKTGMPEIYNNEDLIKKGKVLPAKYFGTLNSATAAKTAGDNTRSLVEQVIANVHYWPGDKIASGASAPAGTSYEEDSNVICKIYTNNPIPYMSAFTVASEFYNAKNLSTNMYLTWGHNKLEPLASEAIVTLKATARS